MQRHETANRETAQKSHSQLPILILIPIHSPPPLVWHIQCGRGKLNPLATISLVPPETKPPAAAAHQKQQQSNSSPCTARTQNKLAAGAAKQEQAQLTLHQTTSSKPAAAYLAIAPPDPKRKPAAAAAAEQEQQPAQHAAGDQSHVARGVILVLELRKCIEAISKPSSCKCKTHTY